MKKNIPNFITLLNLLAGCFSVYFAFEGELLMAGWLIVIAALFDFLDGMMARLLNAKSELGGILDSLADVISFGLAPGSIMLVLIRMTIPLYGWIAFIAFLVPVFSAIRLARFSVDTRQKEYFIGVPTPANALLYASFPMILEQYGDRPVVMSYFSSIYFLLSITFLTSVLLVAGIPLLSMKMKDPGWKSNRPRYILVALGIFLLAFFRSLAVPMIFILYLLVSFFFRKEIK